MLRNKGPTSIIKLYYDVMMIILIFGVFTTSVHRWQQQFVCIRFNAVDACSWFIAQSRTGLGINFVQLIPLRLYKETKSVTITQFIMTP